MDSPRFICDVMLGSLARWLRLFGFDTAYFRSIDDNELIRCALQQERILLTRDTGIAKRKSIKKFILLLSNDTFAQLKEVLKAGEWLKAKGERSPRCAVCNGELAAAEREAVAGRIPEYVFLNATSFLTCRECGKVYWRGSHKKSIDAQLQKILGEIITQKP